MNVKKKLAQVLKRPWFWISVLGYLTVLFGLKVVLAINLVNIFTIGLIPLTAVAIYVIWNLFYDTNIDDEMFDTRIEKLYFKTIARSERSKIRRFMKMREEVQELLGKAHLNPSKSMLLDELRQFDMNDLIEKYAMNCVKIAFIEKYLGKKKDSLGSIRETADKLRQAEKKYKSVNDDITRALESIEAQCVLLLADDASSTYSSKESIDDILNKIEVVDRTNREINQFYGTIHDGESNG
jgi:hypothetical protein